jgi:hypothetical protein
VEGVFSSSKCASISQMCKSRPPRASHLLFITFHSRANRYQLHWTIFGGDRCCTVASIAPTRATCPSNRNPMVDFLSNRCVRCFVTQRLSWTTDVSDAPHPQRPSRNRRGLVRMFLPEFIRRVRRKANRRGVERLLLTLARTHAVPQRQTLEQYVRPRLLLSRQHVCRARAHRAS